MGSGYWWTLLLERRCSVSIAWWTLLGFTGITVGWELEGLPQVIEGLVGSDLPVGERKIADQINYLIPNIEKEAEKYANKKTLVVGSGFSAITAIHDILKLASSHGNTRIVWVSRREENPYEVVADDPLPQRAR